LLAAVRDDPVSPDGLDLEGSRQVAVSAAILRAACMSLKSTAQAQKKKVVTSFFIFPKKCFSSHRGKTVSGC
jgi:hypothetical protein